MRERVGALRRDPRERIRLWRMHYYVDACRLLQFAPCCGCGGERMPAAKRRALERFERADRSLAGDRRAGVARRAGAARPPPRHARRRVDAAPRVRLAAAARRPARATAPTRFARLDSLPPPAFDPRPGARAPGEPAVRVIAEKIAPLRLAVRDDAPRRVNLLIPSIDLQHFFGGYIGKFNLARRLAARGERVRIVTVDPVGALPRAWRRDVEAYSGLDGLLDRVEVAFGRESPGLEVSRADALIATTWWTAHIARRGAALARRRPLPLPDPGVRAVHVPDGQPTPRWPPRATASRTPRCSPPSCCATTSASMARRLRGRRGAGDAASAAFENAITAIDPPAADELAGRRPRRLLFYARPEPHAARNMFELGVLALSRALERGAFADGWELHGIGPCAPAAGSTSAAAR